MPPPQKKTQRYYHLNELSEMPSSVPNKIFGKSSFSFVQNISFPLWDVAVKDIYENTLFGLYS